MIPVYEHIASLVEAIENCRKSGNHEWRARHELRLHCIVTNYMPSGSGIDNGTALDLSASTSEKLVFSTSYHHMNDGGCYDGWTEHTVTVRPSLAHGITVTIGGRNRNDIKDYLGEVYHEALTTRVAREAIDSWYGTE